MDPVKWGLLVVLGIWSLASPATTVDRSKFRSCQQSGFCTRCRLDSSGIPLKLDLSSLKVSSTSGEAVLSSEKGVQFRLEISSIGGTFRIRIREAFPLVERYSVENVLLETLEETPLTLLSSDKSGFILKSGEKNLLEVQADPLRLVFLSDGVKVLTFNARDLLRFEHTRKKNEDESIKEEEDSWVHPWEETYGGNTDSKPRGPQAVAGDFTFHNTRHVYGIPEHADRFSLVDTSSGDPYRLYNLDVFEYEIWNPMALYAAVPFMMGHNAERTTGLFWLNAAETWIDIKKNGDGGVLDSLSNLVTNSPPSVDTHWMSEAGIIDFFVLLGPGPKDVSKQYADLTGPTPLPPMFSVAYHQCRWNYNDQKDVHDVETKFDEYDIPMDVMWLDIEHTDGKKYFTWDAIKFSDSKGMTNNLTAHGRKLVTIVDPHIKKESGYWVHEELTALGLYTKTKEGTDYEGWCWPGASYYPDFLNPEARDYFSKQYAFDKYAGSTLDVYTWNDMNEPSVFNGPEVTMPKDLIHMGVYEHREIHNLYGHLYVMGTNKGHLMRSENKLRPFILTRSAFAGTHRYAAIWTGDNSAEWSHIEASVPMCLSLGIAGFSHCGSDVGGFFGNPDGEMFVRWYQAGAFQPFFRSHAHIDSKRREPWLYSRTEMELIRDAVRLRYSYLPLWYSLFYEGEKTGVPPMRPLWYEFPKDEASFGVDKEHLVGDALLVRPVFEPDVKSVDVYFPPDSLWYDVFTRRAISESGNINVPVTLNNIPVFQRGGSIVPKKERIRRSSKLMKDDPYTLVVALNANQEAKGKLYIDDGESLSYRSGEFLYIDLKFESNKLTGHTLTHPGFKTSSWLERVIVMGLKTEPNKITAKGPISGEFDVDFNFDNNVLIMRKPAVHIAEEWDITLH